VLLFRVLPYLRSARSGRPGHPLYEPPGQRGGRIDHPDYYVWYLARDPEGAVGETFGNLHTWTPSMFVTPFLSGGARALGVYELPDDVRLLDLDDPRALLARKLRPTTVVRRDLAVTQAWGHAIWAEGRWDAVSWWSYHHPGWPVVASWARPRLVRVEPLSLDHEAVQAAAATLCRAVEP
jgi:hypothetical protein